MRTAANHTAGHTLDDVLAELHELRRLVEERLPAPLPTREWWSVAETSERVHFSVQCVRGWARGPYGIGTRHGARGPWQIDPAALRRMFRARWPTKNLPAALR